MPRADYEAELRILLAEREDGAVDDVFPAHEQSHVRGATRP
jgi:predicted subunit of tRNA(5-methylaminomethyl-2-thiouridylate) methyltransferase